jgi:hypothetical protein
MFWTFFTEFKEFSMKKPFKLFGIIAIVAVIWFWAVSCGNDNEINNKTTETETTDDSPPSPTAKDDSPPPPTATFAEIEFFPSHWGKAGEYEAEQWETNNQIKLSSFFTSQKPKEGDVLTFKISGVSNKNLKYISLELGDCLAGDWETYNYLGQSSSGEDNDDRKLVDLHSSFTDVLITVPISNPTVPDAAIYAQLVNLLWKKNASGKYVFNSGETLPVGFKKGDVMATIKDFKISLVKIDSSPNVYSKKGWTIRRDESSTATFNCSVDNDGVCTVTIGGAPEKHEEGAWYAWKISAEYAYTGVADTSYEFKFEAWTQSGARDLHVLYYNDNNDSVYLGDTKSITTTRNTYTVTGTALPKGGKFNVSFQLADQLGTVYLKMLDIKEIE